MKILKEFLGNFKKLKCDICHEKFPTKSTKKIVLQTTKNGVSKVYSFCSLDCFQRGWKSKLDTLKNVDIDASQENTQSVLNNIN